MYEQSNTHGVKCLEPVLKSRQLHKKFKYQYYITISALISSQDLI